uniref:Uncharacterized protein MANES_02G012600 n=1 Tax=Rhizophora mucronata TaxID=61149 RepID=A0A2P2IXC5_RHIMU
MLCHLPSDCQLVPWQWCIKMTYYPSWINRS